jgi:hypothetical protein
MNDHKMTMPSITPINNKTNELMQLNINSSIIRIE